MFFVRSTPVLLAAGACVVLALSSCAKNPGEAYVDTAIRELIASQPGLYELHSTVENPINIVIQGENWVVLRQGKDMIIAGGDTLQDRIAGFAGQNYSIIGRRMGQPKLWFAVDGIVQDEKLAVRIGHTAEKLFPSYEEYSDDLVQDFETVDLNEFDFDKERKIKRDLLGKNVRITGNLVARELAGGVKQYLVESRNLLVALQPVGPNLRYFLEMENVVGAPFVAYGSLTTTLTWDDGTEDDRGSSRIIGPFKVEFLRFNRDIIVRNII